jgi:hypothetical protein
MTETNLNLTPHEAGIIIQWSDKTIHGGHWGDGDCVFPDEGAALEKLLKIKKGEPAVFSARDTEIMLIWLENHCGSHITSGLSLTGEEVPIVKKLHAAAPDAC